MEEVRVIYNFAAKHEKDSYLKNRQKKKNEGTK